MTSVIDERGVDEIYMLMMTTIMIWEGGGGGGGGGLGSTECAGASKRSHTPRSHCRAGLNTPPGPERGVGVIASGPTVALLHRPPDEQRIAGRRILAFARAGSLGLALGHGNG